jgi:hypothetical protein
MKTFVVVLAVLLFVFLVSCGGPSVDLRGNETLQVRKETEFCWVPGCPEGTLKIGHLSEGAIVKIEANRSGDWLDDGLLVSTWVRVYYEPGFEVCHGAGYGWTASGCDTLRVGWSGLRDLELPE